MFFKLPQKDKYFGYNVISLIIGLTLSLMLFAQFITVELSKAMGFSIGVFLITILLFFYKKRFLRWLAIVWIIFIEYLVMINTELFYGLIFLIGDIILMYYLITKKIL